MVGSLNMYPELKTFKKGDYIRVYRRKTRAKQYNT